MIMSSRHARVTVPDPSSCARFLSCEAGSVKLECNKASYETIQVERVENGLVHFKGEDRKRMNNMNSKLNALCIIRSEW